jgi:hypothetical protein
MLPRGAGIYSSPIPAVGPMLGRLGRWACAHDGRRSESSGQGHTGCFQFTLRPLKDVVITHNYKISRNNTKRQKGKKKTELVAHDMMMATRGRADSLDKIKI